MGKVNKAEAQEWLESLQQVGEGWWRQVGLAVSVGAHTSLGMERREFAQAIGQRMVDSREAIVEMHKEKHSQSAIADVLGISRHTVKNVLISEGLVEGEYESKGAYAEIEAQRPDSAEETEAQRPEDEIEQLHAKIENLSLNAQGERAKHKRELDEAKEKAKDLREALTKLKREAHKAAEDELTDVERERVRGLAHLAVDSIVGNLEEAASEVRLLIEQDAVSAEAISQIESAHAGFEEELNVARMSVAINS